MFPFGTAHTGSTSIVVFKVDSCTPRTTLSRVPEMRRSPPAHGFYTGSRHTPTLQTRHGTLDGESEPSGPLPCTLLSSPFHVPVSYQSQHGTPPPGASMDAGPIGSALWPDRAHAAAARDRLPEGRRALDRRAEWCRRWAARYWPGGNGARLLPGTVPPLGGTVPARHGQACGRGACVPPTRNAAAAGRHGIGPAGRMCRPAYWLAGRRRLNRPAGMVPGEMVLAIASTVPAGHGCWRPDEATGRFA